MADNLFTLQGKVEVLTKPTEDQLNKLKASTDNSAKSLDQLIKSSTGVTKAQADLAAGMAKTKQATEQVTGTARNLQSTIRQLTTSMLGNSVVAIAVGTAIGNLAVQMAGQLVRAITVAVTQVQALTNSLAEIPAVGSQAGNVFRQLQDAVTGSNIGIQEMTQRFQQMQPTLNAARISLAEQVKLVTDYQKAINALQPQTIAGAASEALAELGGVIAGLGQLTGISTLITTVLNTITAGFRALRNLLPGAGDVATAVELRRQYSATGDTIETLRSRLDQLSRERRTQVQQMILMLEREREALRQLADERERAERTAELPAKAAATLRELRNEAVLATRTFRLSTIEQEALNRQFQLEIQLLQAGVPLLRAKAEAEAAMGNIRTILFAQQFQGLRDSLMSQEFLEMQSFQRRMELIQGFIAQRLVTQQEGNALFEAEMYRSNSAMQQIAFQQSQMWFNAFAGTAQHAQELFQVLGQKSKAFAVAAIVVGKGLAIAQTIQQGIAASMAALAPPPIGLGPVAGQPLSAAIKALTAVNVGLIAATGAAQIGGALSGGAGGGLPSPTTPGDQPEDQGVMPTRLVIEGVDPNMIFTGEQLNNLIEKINEQAANGTVVISSKLI